MLRARHHALGPVQSTQWATVGHVVAAVGAQARANDNPLQSLRSCSLTPLCAADFLFIFYRHSVSYFLLVFFSILVFPVPHFFLVLFIPLRSALDPFFVFFPLPSLLSLVPLSLSPVCIHLSLSQNPLTPSYRTSVLC